MGTDTKTVVDQALEDAASFRESAQQLQQIAFAQGQNAAQKAALEAQSGMQVDGHFETPESYLVRKQAELDAQKEKQNFAKAMDYSALSYDIARETAVTTRQQMEIANKIQEDSSVSLFDDPALAIANAFTLPWDQQAFEGTGQKLKMLNEAKANMDARLQSHVKSTDDLKSSITDASILSTTRALKTIQSIREIDATNAALASDATGIKDVMHATQAATSSTFQALQAQNMAEERAYRRAAMEELKATRSARLEEVNTKAEAKKTAVKYVNAARMRDGLGELPELDILNGLAQPKGSKVGEQFANWYDRGIARAAGIDVSDGDTPQERLAYWSSTGTRPKNERQLALIQLTAEAVKKANAENKDKAAAAVAADKAVEQKLSDWRANIVPGDSSNPFQPPSYEAIESMEGLKGMKAYPVLATLLTDTNKTRPIDQQQVFETLTAAVISRDISPADATALMSTMYKKLVMAVNIQADTLKYTGKGLDTWNATIKHQLLPGQDNMITAHLVPKIGIGTVNMTDEVQLQREIAREVALKLGASLNTMSQYPAGWKGGMYPPLFQSGAVMPTMR